MYPTQKSIDIAFKRNVKSINHIFLLLNLWQQDDGTKFHVDNNSNFWAQHIFLTKIGPHKMHIE